MPRNTATLIGLTAILMWSSLASLTIASAPVPPFLWNSITFGLGGALGLIWTGRRSFGILRKAPWSVYAFGSAALFAYHTLYVLAFRIGPSAETGLIAYLWPLFIVLLSGLLPGEKLTARHILGALLAFAGAAVILFTRTESGAAPIAALGIAFACAVIWAGYSVLSRRLGTVPSESVTVYCLVTAALSLVLHLALETPAWPSAPGGWLALLALGLGPVGAAFFTWDIGMKQGDIQLLGVASYAAPLLSTLVLVVFGLAAPSLWLALAAVLITGGAALAALNPRR